MIAVTGPFPSNQHTTYPPAGRHHRADAVPPARPRRRFGPGAIVGIVVAVVAVLVGVGFVVTAVIRPPTAPDDEPRPAAAADPVTVRLGETLRYRAGKISADYALTQGRPLTLTPSGSRPSRGAFLGLTATVTVDSGIGLPDRRQLRPHHRGGPAVRAGRELPVRRWPARRPRGRGPDGVRVGRVGHPRRG